MVTVAYDYLGWNLKGTSKVGRIKITQKFSQVIFLLYGWILHLLS